MSMKRRSSTVIHVHEDAYRMVQKLKDEAARQGHKISASDVIETAASRMIHRGADDEPMASNEEEERLVRKLLTALRIPRPRSVRRLVVGLIENLLDEAAFRDELDE